MSILDKKYITSLDGDNGITHDGKLLTLLCILCRLAARPLEPHLLTQIQGGSNGAGDRVRPPVIAERYPPHRLTVTRPGAWDTRPAATGSPNQPWPQGLFPCLHAIMVKATGSDE